MPDCVYLGEEQPEKITPDGRKVFTCKMHGCCTKASPPNPFAACESCVTRTLPDDRDLSIKFVDHLKVYDRDRSQTHALRNMLGGRPAFLVCGGPSAKTLPLYELEQRGIFSLAVNNMAGYYNASAFLCSDPPSKFHNGIWLDPSTMKFIPSPKMARKRGGLREKVGDEFKELHRNGERVAAADCPNVWGFERRAWWQCDDSFFIEDSAAWGNHDAGVLRTGEKKTVCTPLLGLRLLYYLGARTIYLVGVDFNMDVNVGLTDNYAFGEERDANAIDSNNRQYAIVNEWLVKMKKQGTFSKYGLSVYNCNPQSCLRAFEHVPFDLAVKDTLKDYPKQPFDLEGWYKK